LRKGGFHNSPYFGQASPAFSVQALNNGTRQYDKNNHGCCGVSRQSYNQPPIPFAADYRCSRFQADLPEHGIGSACLQGFFDIVFFSHGNSSGGYYQIIFLERLVQGVGNKVSIVFDALLGNGSATGLNNLGGQREAVAVEYFTRLTGATWLKQLAFNGKNGYPGSFMYPVVTAAVSPGDKGISGMSPA